MKDDINSYEGTFGDLIDNNCEIVWAQIRLQSHPGIRRIGCNAVGRQFLDANELVNEQVYNADECVWYSVGCNEGNVQLVKHLGHIITSDLTGDKDIIHQTSMYNRKAITVLSDFKHISGDLHVKIMQSYCSSFYGSQLRDLSNKYIDM